MLIKSMRKVPQCHTSANHQKCGKLYGFGEVLIVHGTHTNKKGSVNVEFKVPAKKWSKICKP